MQSMVSTFWDRSSLTKIVFPTHAREVCCCNQIYVTVCVPFMHIRVCGSSSMSGMLKSRRVYDTNTVTSCHIEDIWLSYELTDSVCLFCPYMEISVCVCVCCLLQYVSMFKYGFHDAIMWGKAHCFRSKSLLSKGETFVEAISGF